MGFLKNLQMEQMDDGFSTTRWADDVCDECIDDDGLARFVGRHGAIESCSFCRAAPAQGATLDTLFHYMAGCLTSEWDDPGNSVGWEGGWQGAEVYDSYDLLEILEEPLAHPDLRAEFVRAFDREWCQRDPYGWLPHDRLQYSWAVFCELVRTRHRFLFMRQDTTDSDDLVPPAQMLDSVAAAISNTSWRVLRQLPAGTRIFRTRAHTTGEHPSSAAELGSPPSHRAAPNRMSPAGISLFYGAEDATTSEAEVANQPLPMSTTARWHTTRPLWCLDLPAARPVPSIFDMTASSDRPWLLFLAHFADEASKAATPDAPDVSYVPTQIFTEYVRDVMTVPHTGEPIEAIRFTSSTCRPATCLTVLCGPEGCTDSATLTKSAVLMLEDGSLGEPTPSGYPDGNDS